MICYCGPVGRLLLVNVTGSNPVNKQITTLILEAWPSGLWHLSTKQKGWKQPRGFDSHRFLHFTSKIMNIFPVIHYLSDEQTLHNVELAQKYGCKGVFVIDMNGNNKQNTLQIATYIAKQYPHLEVGVNHLGTSPYHAVQRNINSQLSMTWTDKCLTHTVSSEHEDYVGSISSLLLNNKHSLFSAVAFKYQPDEPHPGIAAQKAIEAGFIPTTSGVATGKSISLQKLEDIRSVIGQQARLAVASGVTSDNVFHIKDLVTDILVASSITFENSEIINEVELDKLVNSIH